MKMKKKLATMSWLRERRIQIRSDEEPHTQKDDENKRD